MQNICLIGASGRMGNAIQAQLGKSVVIYPFTRLNADNSSTLIAAMAKSEIAIDFSNPHNLAIALDACIKNQKPYLCGTTGLEAEHHRLLTIAAEKIPVLYTANTSMGLAILKKAVALVTKSLANHSLGSRSTITISEVHHRFKKDMPSGTALALGDMIHQITDTPPTYASIRGGNVVGTHTVHFFQEDEVITLSHECLNRNVFADGAIKAAAWLVRQPSGLYSLDDLLEINNA